MIPTTQQMRSVRQGQVYSDIQIDLTLRIFSKLLPMVIVGSLSMVAITALMAYDLRDRGVWVFTWVMLLASVMRIVPVVAFYRRQGIELTQSRAAQWRAHFTWTILVYCCCFAAETIYAYLYCNYAARMLCTMGVFSLCAMFGSRPGPQPWVGKSCTLIMLSALALGILHQGGILFPAGIILICAFAWVQCDSIQTRFEAMVDQMRTRRKMQLLAEQDTLTGLASRYQFEQRLAQVCRQQTQVALLFIDLDRFKSVNDTFGHAVGDQLLRQVARRISSSVRISDVVARLGGDEFAIMQSPAPSEQTIQVLAQRINNNLAAPFEIDGHSIAIEASIGIHLTQPGTGDDPAKLLNSADRALYGVKRAGGGTFSFFGPTDAPST
jgi:diguanylate cyclase (GGDEF)-like protein